MAGEVVWLSAMRLMLNSYFSRGNFAYTVIKGSY